MPEMPDGDVIGGEVISSDWGNDIRDRTVQRYATTAERTTEHGAPIPGDLAYMEDTGDVDIFHAGTWRHLGPPVGAVQMLAGGSVPVGWLVCNGTAVSRTTYATLFTAIGTTWGAGNGTTTFNVPDLRGKVPRGVATSGTGTRWEGRSALTLTLQRSGPRPGPGSLYPRTHIEYRTCPVMPPSGLPDATPTELARPFRPERPSTSSSRPKEGHMAETKKPATKPRQPSVLDQAAAAEQFGISEAELVRSRMRGLAPGTFGVRNKDGLLVWSRKDLTSYKDEAKRNR